MNINERRKEQKKNITISYIMEQAFDEVRSICLLKKNRKNKKKHCLIDWTKETKRDGAAEDA